MSQQINKFIETIGVLARNEYLSRPLAILPSVCIAQAALESGWNLNARSVFGIKGNDGFASTTSEYRDGHYEQIVDIFKEYPDIATSVVGYYDFLRDTQDESGEFRYHRALNNSDYKQTVYFLIHTSDGAPYATDPDYIEKIIDIINDFNLTDWDVAEEQHPVTKVIEPVAADFGDIIAAVKRGDYGNGAERVQRLEAAGYNFQEVQDAVNATYDSPSEAPVEQPVPTPNTTAVVMPGDGFWSIAERELGSGTLGKKLAEFNGMDYDTHILYAGDVLNLPN